MLRRRLSWSCLVALICLLTTTGRAFDVSPEPDLSIEFNPEGRIVGVSTQQLPRNVLGLGGWEMRDLGDGDDEDVQCGFQSAWIAGISEPVPVVAALLDPPPEALRPAPRWLLGGEWRVGAGPTPDAVLQPTPESTGSLLRLVAPVTAAVRAGASFTLTARLTGDRPVTAGLLCLNSAGRPTMHWQPVHETPGPGDLRQFIVPVQPPSGTAGLMLVFAPEPGDTELRCTGASLTTHWPGELNSFDGQITETADGASFTGTAAGLDLAVNYRSVDGAIEIAGQLTSQTATDRAVSLTFRVPLDGNGWNWWHGPWESEPVPASLARAIGTWRLLPSGELLSPWPLGVVSRDSPAGLLALAHPPSQPALVRYGFRQEDGLFATIDLGLAPAAGHASAAFQLAMFAAEPRWGMRGALERLHRLWPSTARPATPAGAWFVGIDPSALVDPARLGLRFDDQPESHRAWDPALDILATTRWAPPASGTELNLPAGGRGSAVLAEPLAVNGQWYAAPDQWAAWPHALAANGTTRAPVLPTPFWRAQQLSRAKAQLAEEGRWLLGGPPPELPVPSLLPGYDVLVAGHTRPPVEHLRWLRALAPLQPLTYLEPELLNPATLAGVQRTLWHEAISARAFPGAVGLFTTDLATANASWFGAGVPLLSRLTALGWAQVPFATVADTMVEVQRFGNGDNIVFLVRNHGDNERNVTLRIEPVPLGLRAGPTGLLPSLVDLLAPDADPRGISRSFNAWQCGLVLAPKQLLALQLGPPVDAP
ncbi:MAG TPA: hypothetical protein DCZ72_00665 [Armatimonadetes bacterium]|nr:hypothetical protein [Armatimonadota bacterium]